MKTKLLRQVFRHRSDQCATYLVVGTRFSIHSWRKAFDRIQHKAIKRRIMEVVDLLVQAKEGNVLDILIKETAYQYWQDAGCPEGRDLEFWLKAEKTPSRVIYGMDVRFGSDDQCPSTIIIKADVFPPFKQDGDYFIKALISSNLVPNARL